jgi:hypothetical protein
MAREPSPWLRSAVYSEIGVQHLRSNAIAYLALFVALGGGTAVAVSGGLKADTVDGLSAAKFRVSDTAATENQTVIDLAGMRIIYRCDGIFRKRGSNAHLDLALQVNNDNAEVTLQFTTGSTPDGSSFTVRNLGLAANEDFDLDQNRSFGRGSVTYSRPNGRVANLEYGFDQGGNECFAHGVALGG